MIDTLIKNAMVITVDLQRRVFMNGAIVIHDGNILEVGPSDPVSARYEAAQVIDAAGMIAMPGMVNCHFHLPQVLMRGINDNTDAMHKLKYYIWPVQGHYDEQDALVSTRLGLLEMIKAGTTAFLSTGLHPRYGLDAIAEAMIASGIRGVISKYVMDISAYALDSSALDPGLWETGEESMRQAIALIEKWDGAANGRLHAWFSPRSVGGCSVALLKEVSRLAAEYGVGITAHWAEVQNNVDYTMEKYGLLPAEFAESVGLLGPNVTFAHGIYFTDGEIELLGRTRTNICHCPVCNTKLAMGIAKVPQMLAAGANVCLGNDGVPVNNTADMFREMRTALLIHRVNSGNAEYPTAAQAIEMATINGAKAIMADRVVGSLEAGKRADVILIDTHKPHIYPVYDPVSVVAWAANGSDVDTVLIDGQVVMRHREVLTLDEAQILADAQARSHKILEQAGVRPNLVWPLL
jgi:cytosine/adenosine deaminase-related metal-dependent hydrolase